MKKTSLFVIALLASQTAYATEEPFKMLRCPAVPQVYTQMITDLSLLKTAIKRDAACAPVQGEVNSLSSLLNERRQEVVDLMEKSKKEPLTEKDLGVVKKYLEDVTKKVFSTADLLSRNDNCFSSDNQALGLSDLASITLDASALASSVAGPWSAPISLGGQAIAGIMQGLDKVMKNKRGYDFSKVEQRQSYVQSLCAYYNYRQDIDHLLFPDQRVAQLQDLRHTLTTNLNGMVANCPECRQINDMATKGNSPAEINNLANSANSAYKMPLGSLTVKTITSLNWVRGELNRLAQDMEGNASVGRDLVSEIKADIEGFLFDKEAPQFVRFQNNKAMDLFGEFRSYSIREGENLLYTASEYVSQPIPNLYQMDELDVIAQVKALRTPLTAKGQNGLLGRVSEYERRTSDLLARTKLAMEVQLAYCDFFQRAGLYTSSVQYACEGSSAENVKDALARIQKKTPSASPELGLMVQEKAVPVVADWATGLQQMVQKLSSDPHLYDRK
jgi:hypothetical protein